MGYISLLASVDSTRHPDWETLGNYCFELEALAMDLGNIGTRLLGQYYDVTDAFEDQGSEEELRIKKFLVTHVFEDTCYRLYAYQEKAFQLVNAALAAGVSEQDRQLRDNVRGWLQQNVELTVLERLDSLLKNKTIREMVGHRHGFSHRLSPHELRSLSGPRRLIEDLLWEQGTAQLPQPDGWDMLSASLDVGDYRERLRQRLDDACQVLEAFEAGLCRDLAEALARRGWLREGAN